MPPTEMLNGVEASPLTASPRSCEIGISGVVACSRAIVARRYQHGDALGRRLFPQRVVKRVAHAAERALARSIAFAQHCRNIVVDDVQRGQIDPRGHRLRLGVSEIDKLTLGFSANPLTFRNIQVGLLLIGISGPKIGSIQNNLRIIRG